MAARYLFRSLAAQVRATMRSEVEDDITAGVLYPSKSFNPEGAAAYPSLLLEAVKEHDEEWLASRLASAFLLLDAKGKRVRRDMPSFFAGCEFNRFYIRGVCAFAQERGDEEVEVYRARASSRPRPESEALIGRRYPPSLLLEDLRSHIGTTTEHKVPLINSGLSVCLCER